MSHETNRISGRIQPYVGSKINFISKSTEIRYEVKFIVQAQMGYRLFIFQKKARFGSKFVSPSNSWAENKRCSPKADGWWDQCSQWRRVSLWWASGNRKNHEWKRSLRSVYFYSFVWVFYFGIQYFILRCPNLGGGTMRQKSKHASFLLGKSAQFDSILEKYFLYFCKIFQMKHPVCNLLGAWSWQLLAIRDSSTGWQTDSDTCIYKYLRSSFHFKFFPLKI